MQWPSVEGALIARSRLASVVLETPFQRLDRWSEQLQASVFMKREDLQQVRSFKIRGGVQQNTHAI